MMIGVAPKEMRLQDIIVLSALPDGRTAWEINFEVDNLHDLKKILQHFEKAGLGHEFVLDH